jgi:hypothetical protein
MLRHRNTRHSKPGANNKAAPHPALADLHAAQRDLREERLGAAWVDLDNATLTLSCDRSSRPMVAKTMLALERARDRLARADIAAAAAAIASAVVALSAL